MDTEKKGQRKVVALADRLLRCMSSKTDGVADFVLLSGERIGRYSVTREETWERLVDLGVAQGQMPPKRHERWDLCWTQLRWADLSEAKLVGAKLEGAKLQEAKLRGANLRNANLSEADLCWADLSGADLSGARLRGANLQGANLQDAKLVGAKLEEADLYRAKLIGAKLRGANLSGTHLEDTEFSQPDLRGANLSGTNLSRIRLVKANLRGADLTEADLTEADLTQADLAFASLTGANLSGTKLVEATLVAADLQGADLQGADLTEADLRGADLSGADLRRATLVRVDFQDAVLTDCLIYGISAWDLHVEGAEQSNLVITDTDGDGSCIAVDSLKMAQFIYLLLENREIREVIDAITSKVVLILGPFGKHKPVLDAVRVELRRRGLVPILFDFDKPGSKDLTATIETLARMARFIVADISNPSSVPHELATIVPHLRTTPVRLLQLKGSRTSTMTKDLIAYPWVVKPIHLYQDTASLIESMERVVEPAESMVEELRTRANANANVTRSEIPPEMK